LPTLGQLSGIQTIFTPLYVLIGPVAVSVGPTASRAVTNLGSGNYAERAHAQKVLQLLRTEFARDKVDDIVVQACIVEFITPVGQRDWERLRRLEIYMDDNGIQH